MLSSRKCVRPKAGQVALAKVSKIVDNTDSRSIVASPGRFAELKYSEARDNRHEFRNSPEE